MTVTIGALVALVGTFLTWVRSGTAERSSYEIFDLVDRLGFSPDGPVGWAVRLWPLVPLLLVLTVVVRWWPTQARWMQLGRDVLPGVTAVWVGATAAAIAAAPEGAGVIRIGPGPVVTVLGAAVMILGVVISATRRARSARPSTPEADRS